MKPLRHFIVTHFNVRRSDHRYDASGAPVDRNGAPVRTVEWLEHRLALFERYCLPSIAGQTNQDFLWFVRYDPREPGDCGGRLARYAAAYSNLRPLPVKEWFSACIEREISPDTECVVTTRLDNDDALHREAVADVQSHCRPGTTEFLNLLNGYVYDHASGQASPRVLPDGPFVSFVENPRSAPLRTVLRFSHREVARVAPVRQIDGGPRWLQVIHDRNLTNRFQCRQSSRVELEPEFAIGATGETLMRRLGLTQESPSSASR
jgi:hypothetical protein